MVHSPIPIDDALAAEIAGWARCSTSSRPALITTCTPASSLARFPGAKRLGAPGVAQKRPDLPLERARWTTEPRCPGPEEIDQITSAGAPKLNEVVFFHRARRSLLV